MNYYVYILYSPGSDKFYHGQTNHLKDRLHRHNSGVEKSTKNGAPWKLIWYTVKSSRADALDLERKLKNLSRARLIKFMKKYPEGSAGPDALVLIDKWSGC